MSGRAIFVKKRCIVIPAIKKNAVIPDQLVKKLAGITLMERALNTARACAPGQDVITLTDSEEIGLICQRAGTRHIRDKGLKFHTYDIVAEMRGFLRKLALEYRHCVILRASAPLLTWVDLEDAWKKYLASQADCLITVRAIKQRLWRESEDMRGMLLAAGGGEGLQKSYLVESRALIILDLASLDKPDAKTVPYFLDERGIEIQNYQDWWICERLLERRHVVFVVAGYAAIGMGHVYRALMLAHEITRHQITFVCTRQSELALENVASRDYRVLRQGKEPLWETVLAQKPDLVVNDFLDTSAEYMRRLLDSGARCVNFEDMGEGAELASLVINALYNDCPDSPRMRCGPAYFCLRDEFLHASRNAFRPNVETLLITFGGTDQRDFTRRTLDVVEPICRDLGIKIRIVTGPGYAHKEKLERRLEELANPLILFAWATNIMSRMMEGADLALCSAGRTVYELAHMRVPGIVFATHGREARHPFARPRNGFLFAGLMEKARDWRVRNLFLAMLKEDRRSLYWQRQNRIDFTGNKSRVIGLMLDQLEKSENL